MVNAPETNWKQLDIAICGAGISGFAAAVALRRAGVSLSIHSTALQRVANTTISHADGIYLSVHQATRSHATNDMISPVKSVLPSVAP